MLILKRLVGYAHAFARLEQPGHVQLGVLVTKRAVLRVAEHANDSD